MSTDIIVQVIIGVVTLAGVIITGFFNTRKTRIESDTKQQIFNTRLESQVAASNQLIMQKVDALADEVREHNNYARRLPVVEQKVEDLTRRVSDVERKVVV